MEGFGIVAIALFVFVAVTVAKGVRIIPQGEEWIVQRLGKYRDDIDEIGELIRIALSQVVCREQVERDDVDAELVTPSEKLTHLRGAGTMAVRGGRVTELFGPAAVAVNHHRDMVRHVKLRQLTTQSRRVEAIQRTCTTAVLSEGHLHTLPLVAAMCRTWHTQGRTLRE